MLHLILGRAGSGKTHRVYEIMEQLPAGEEVILLVPEQYSFESERRMLGLPREKQGEVLSFSRLCQRVFMTLGGMAGRPVSEQERLLLMIRAIRQNAHLLNIYRRQKNSMEFARQMLSLAKECTYGGITPAALAAAQRRLPENSLKAKVEEIALITAAYEALLMEAYIDPDEELGRLYELLAREDFWKNKTVLIDGFKDFTAPQKKIVEQIIAGAKEVYVTLCADSLAQKHELEVFANTKGLAAALCRMADKAGVKKAKEELLTVNRRADDPALAAMERVLSGEDEEYAPSTDSVMICGCRDKYDEGEFVAATICRLVREEGLRYRDITVLSRNPEEYEGVLETAFERYGIPYFSDRRRPITHQPIVAYGVGGVALGAIRFDSPSLLSLLKTGLAGLDTQEIAQLENYVFTWKLTGKDWLSPFEKNPQGITDRPIHQPTLDGLNALRLRAITPVLKLKNELEKGRTVRDYAGAVYRFVSAQEVYDSLQELSRRLSQGGEPFEGEDVFRAFTIFVEILDRTVAAMGNTPMTPAEFYEILQQGVKTGDMGKIPQGIDQVTVGGAAHTRPAAPAAVFLLGANQGVFPGVPASGGLLTDSERQQLNQQELPLSDHGEFDTVEELFLFYTAACSARKKVFFSYPERAGGNSLSPCAPLERLSKLFPGIRVCRPGEWEQQDPLARCRAVGPAFDLLADHYKEGSPLAGSLYAYFEKEQAGRLQMLRQLTQPADCRLSPKNAKTLFGDTITISPSGVEVYHKCRFSYFCRYGLRVNPKKAVDLDVLSRGTLVHYVLEQLLKAHGSRGLSTLTAQQMQSNIHSLLDQYVQEVMGGLEGQPHTFRFQLERIEALLLSMVEHMAAELAESEFETVACELKIHPTKGDISPMVIDLPDGGTLSVTGVVDRLDVYEKDGITYFRVVDYKTGTKTFDLDDIYYGIGLQMLIYLYSVEKNGVQFGEHRHPAGILYMPARRVNIRSAGSEADQKAALAKTLQMKGLILDDPTVIYGMDPHATGLYVPLSFKKDGSLSATSSLASAEFFGKTRKRIEELLYEMGKNLAGGEITCDPLDSVGGGGACGYCDYKSVCPLNGGEVHRQVPSLTAAQEKDLLKGGDYHGI